MSLDEAIDLVVVVAFLAAGRLLQRNMVANTLFLLPGTILHELAHFIVGLVTFARPSSFSVIPTRTATGWMLGAVSIGNARWFNGALVALAPLILIPVVILIYLYGVRAYPLSSMYHWGFLYLAIVAAMSSLPSMTDLRLAWKCSAPAILIGLLVGTVYGAWRFHFL